MTGEEGRRQRRRQAYALRKTCHEWQRLARSCVVGMEDGAIRIRIPDRPTPTKPDDWPSLAPFVRLGGTAKWKLVRDVEKKPREKFERAKYDMVLAALRETGNVAAAAKRLGKDDTTIYRWMHKWGLVEPLGDGPEYTRWRDRASLNRNRNR